MALKSSSLEYGQVGESKIAEWFKAGGRRGKPWAILPVYQLEKDTGKGPRIFDNAGNLVAPDMLAMGAEVMLWIEAKHKERFTWHRLTKSWRTGIDWHHYQDYLKVRQRYGLPLWLMFLHENDEPHARDIERGCPAKCPTGLFGNEILALVTMHSQGGRSHFHRNGGLHGMIYWERAQIDGKDGLRLLASLEDVTRAAQGKVSR